MKNLGLCVLGKILLSVSLLANCGLPGGSSGDETYSQELQMLSGATNDDSETIFYKPIDIAVSTLDSSPISPEVLYVLDAGLSQVVVTSRQGELYRILGQHGSGPGEFGFEANKHGSSQVACGTDFVVVADNIAHQLLLFGKSGKFVNSTRIFSHVYGLEVTRDDRIVIGTNSDSLITEYSKDLEVLRRYGLPLIESDLPLKSLGSFEVVALSDSSIGVAFHRWPILRVYVGGESTTQSSIVWSSAFPEEGQDHFTYEVQSRAQEIDPNSVNRMLKEGFPVAEVARRAPHNILTSFCGSDSTFVCYWVQRVFAINPNTGQAGWKVDLLLPETHEQAFRNPATAIRMKGNFIYIAYADLSSIAFADLHKVTR